MKVSMQIYGGPHNLGLIIQPLGWRLVGTRLDYIVDAGGSTVALNHTKGGFYDLHFHSLDAAMIFLARIKEAAE